MRVAFAATIAVVLAAVLSSCGGDGGSQPSPGVLDEPSPTPLDLSGVRVLLEADCARLSADTDCADALDGVKDVLEKRLTAFGATVFRIEIQPANRLSASLQGATAEEARKLLGSTARLEFHRPVVNEADEIVCETPDGSTYAQPFMHGLSVVDRENNVMSCWPN
jgi:hypothetical protein